MTWKHATNRARSSDVQVREPISLRVPQEALELIDEAARLLGRSRTDFILESARNEAQDVLLERKFFKADPEQFEKIMDLLDNPPAPNAKLRKLMKTRAPW